MASTGGLLAESSQGRRGEGLSGVSHEDPTPAGAPDARPHDPATSPRPPSQCCHLWGLGSICELWRDTNTQIVAHYSNEKIDAFLISSFMFKAFIFFWLLLRFRFYLWFSAQSILVMAVVAVVAVVSVVTCVFCSGFAETLGSVGWYFSSYLEKLWALFLQVHIFSCYCLSFFSSQNPGDGLGT